MSKAHLKLVAPAIVKRTVTPTRPPNADLRTREHLTEAEVERLMDAARKNRWGHRDATMVLVAYRHGFRPAELVDSDGIRSTSLRERCMFVGSSGERQAPIRSLAMKYEPSGAFSASSSRSRPSCSRRSEEHPSAPQGSPA
jgi:site-specific recombinase XerD